MNSIGPSLPGTSTSTSSFPDNDRATGGSPAPCDLEIRKLLPAEFCNPRKCQQEGSKEIKNRKTETTAQKIPAFSINDAFVLFRDSCLKSLNSSDYKDNNPAYIDLKKFSPEQIDQAIAEDWEEADYDLRKPYIRAAWCNYEWRLSQAKVCYPREASDKAWAIAAGDAVRTCPRPQVGSIKQRYRDKDIIVIEKPSGQTSHRTSEFDTLGQVKQRCRSARLIHRLDKATSGLMVFALNRRSEKHLHKQFRTRQVHKKYIAEVWGKPPQDNKGHVDLSLQYDKGRQLQRVDPQNGKPSLTFYQSVENSHRDYDRLILEPVTGRTHQLRAHMGAIGCPILGCQLYGHQQSFEASNRLHLHASELKFSHPRTKKVMEFQSNPPF